MQTVHRIAVLPLKGGGEPDDGLQQDIRVRDWRGCRLAVSFCDCFTDLKLQPNADLGFGGEFLLDLRGRLILICFRHGQLDLHAAAAFYDVLILTGKGSVLSGLLKHLFKIADHRLDILLRLFGLDLYHGIGLSPGHDDRADRNILAYDLNLDRHDDAVLFGHKVINAGSHVSKAVFALVVSRCRGDLPVAQYQCHVHAHGGLVIALMHLAADAVGAGGQLWNGTGLFVGVVSPTGARLLALTGFRGGCGDDVAAPVVAKGFPLGNMTACTGLGRFAGRLLPVVVQRRDRRLCRDHFLTHGALAALRHATLLAGRRNGGDGLRRMRKLGSRDIRCRKFPRSAAVAEQVAADSTTIMFDISGGGAGCRNSGNQRQTVGVGRCYGADIAAGVAVRVAVIAINVGRKVELFSAVVLALMPVAALVVAPIA